MKKLFALLLFPCLVFGQTQIDDYVGGKTAYQLFGIIDDQTDSDSSFWQGTGSPGAQHAAIFAFLDSMFITNGQNTALKFSSQFSSLSAALTAAIADTSVLVINARHNIATTTTISGVTALLFLRDGRFNNATGALLTINTPTMADKFQIFENNIDSVRFGVGTVDKVYAEWMGAKGDGTTDDYAAIDAALKAANGNAPVVLLDRTYHVESSIGLVSNVSLIGAGQFATRIQADASDLADHLFIFNADSHIVVSDMSIELRPNSSTYNIFHFTSAPHHITLKDLELDSTDAWHINLRGNAHDVLIDNVNMRYNKGAVGDDGIDLAGCYNVRIANCFINVFDDAIVLKTLDGPTYNITITNCVLSSQIGGGIAIGGEVRSGDIYNVSVSNCAMYDCLAGIYHRGEDSASQYNGNSVYNINYSNISIYALGVGIADYGIRQKVNSTGLQAGSNTRFKKWRDVNFSNFTIRGEFDFDAVNLDSAYRYNFDNFHIVSDTVASGTGLNRYGYSLQGSDEIKIHNGFIGGNLEKYKYGTRTQGFDRNFLISGSDYVDIYNIRADSSKVSGASDYPCSIGSGSANCTVRFNSFSNPNSTNGDGIEFFSGSTFAGNRVQWNVGFVTENDGTATLANGNTSIAVTHGLDVTPEASDIMVNPIETLGTASFWWVDTITSTQFTINTNADPGADVDFMWKIRTGDQ